MAIDGIIGDPAGMRAYAMQLRQAADALGTLASSVTRGVRSMTFEGPAAPHFRSHIERWGFDVAGAVGALNDAADILLRGATRVEAERAEVERKRREDAQRAEDERRKAAAARGSGQ